MDSMPNSPSPEQLLEHAAWLRRLAGTLVLDAARADDVTQQTLLEALQRAPARVEHSRAWLATVARNFARSWSRSDTRRQSLERATARPEAEPAADEVVARTAQHHLVVGAVLALAEPYRTTVLLRFFENLKPGAIAKRTGAPVETVRTRLKRGLELLRAELVQRRGNWAAVCVGLIEPSVHAAASRLLLANAGVAGGVVGGVVMGVKTKVAIGVVVVACAIVAVVDRRTAPTARPRDANAESKTAVSSAVETADPKQLAAARQTEAQRAVSSRAIVAHVADESGAPLAGVRVGVVVSIEGGRTERSSLPFSFVDGSVATTTGEGEATFVVDEAHVNRIVDVAALADGCVPGWWPNARAGDRIALTLKRSGALAGVVRDLSGAPIAGAVVRAVVHGPRQFDATTTSASDGSYRLAGYLGPNVRFSQDQWEPSWMTVAADGFATAHFWSLENVRAERDGSFRLDPYLGRGATIGGRVVDAVDGSAIADADVWIRLWDPRIGRIEFATKSAADGAFVIEGVPAWGVQRVGMHSPNLNTRYLGQLHATALGRGCDARSLDVPEEGTRVTFTLRLARVGSVRGRVVDEAGRSVVGAWVGAAGRAAIGFAFRDEIAGKPFERTVTDENGNYELRDLSLADGPGTCVPLNARFESEQFASTENSQVRVALEAGRTIDAPDLVVKPIPGLVVHVVDEAGRDIEGAIVDKWIRTKGAPGHDDGALNSKTAANGRIFIPFAPSTSASQRKTYLAVRAVGFAATNRDLESETGGIKIALASEHHVRGWIRDADGRAGGGTVYVFPALVEPQDLEAALRTDERWNEIEALAMWEEVSIGSGRFVVRGLGPGPWHVVALRRFEDGSRSVVVVPDVTDENTELELVLPRSAEKNPVGGPGAEDGSRGVGQVEVGLTFADTGKPVLRPGYLALRVDGKDRDGFPIAPGRYLFENVPAGPAELRIDVPGGARDSRSLVVDAGRATSLAVVVSTGLVARGRIDLADVARLQSGTVRLDSNDGGGWVSAPLGEDGAYEVAGLVSGKTYRFSVHVTKADGSFGSWVADGSRRAAEEWTTSGAPHLVVAGGFVVRSRNQVANFPAGTVARLVDAEGRDAFVVTFHGNSNNYGDFLAVGSYTARLQIPGAALQEQAVTISDSVGSYVDFDAR
jgi:RNA polymerase sigma-70 factor (ECF subfamily)